METNAIYRGDCKDILANNIPDKSIDLIYVDPPFFTGKNYEVIWKDGYEIRSFKDAQWYSKDGKRREDIYVYLDWLKERVEQCYRVLKIEGSFYLHCDWHANAYIRVYVLDKIFGIKNFKNEIIWHYGAKASQKYPAFQRKYDTIFIYSKSKKFTFTKPLQEYSDATLAERKTRYKFKDKNGKHYRLTTRRDSSGKKYRAKVYLHEGVPMDDVWDISIINATAKERLGYPTQKPESLLERIIKASSHPEDIILDPMCGCGTAIAVAHRLKRNWIGIDVSPTACNLMADRMRKLKASPKMINMPATVDDLKKIDWQEFQNWVVRRFGGRIPSKKVGDMGIDGLTFELIPIQAKQSPRVGRNVVDNFETAIRRYYAGSKRKMEGIIVAFSFTSNAYDEAHRVHLENGMTIELKTVDELIKEKKKDK